MPAPIQQPKHLASAGLGVARAAAAILAVATMAVIVLLIASFQTLLINRHSRPPQLVTPSLVPSVVYVLKNRFGNSGDEGRRGRAQIRCANSGMLQRWPAATVQIIMRGTSWGPEPVE